MYNTPYDRAILTQCNNKVASFSGSSIKKDLDLMAPDDIQLNGLSPSHREEFPSCFQTEIISLREKLDPAGQWVPNSSNTKKKEGKVNPSTFATIMGQKSHEEHMKSRTEYDCRMCSYKTSIVFLLGKHLEVMHGKCDSTNTEAVHEKKRPNILRRKRHK